MKSLIKYSLEAKTNYISNISDIKNIINKYPQVIIKFYAKWCGPCQRVKSHYTQLASEYLKVEFKEVDIDQVKDAKHEFKFKTIPHFKYYSKGKLKGELSNSNEKVLKNFIKEHLEP